MGVGSRLIVEQGGQVVSEGYSAAIWYELYTSDPAAPNYIDNRGTIGRGEWTATQSDTAIVSYDLPLEFTNYSTGVVYGSIYSSTVGDNRITLHNGSLVTGKIYAAEDTAGNILTLTGDAGGGVGTFSNDYANFNTLYKTGAGAWNFTQSLGKLADLGDNYGVYVKGGTLHLDYSSVNTSGYTKNTKAIEVQNGSLIVDNPVTTTIGDINVASGARLEGIGNVGSVVNAGVVAPGHDRLADGILRINGNYEAKTGAALQLTTIFGDDNSATSKLHIVGNIVGNAVTRITDYNLGGHGADTIHGIKIIQVDGQSNSNAFTLDTNFTYNGVKVIHIDDYSYYLHEGSVPVGNAASESIAGGDGNFYLSTMHEGVQSVGTLGHGEPGPVMNPGETWPSPDQQGDPNQGGSGGTGGAVIGGQRPNVVTPAPRIYSPIIPLYEALPQVMLGMNRLGAMQERNGNKNWTAFDPSNPCYSGGMASSVDGFGMWTAIEAGHSKQDPKRTTAPYDYDLNYYRVKLGLEGPLAKMGACGTLIGGVFGHYGRGESDVESDHMGFGDINLDQWGAGGYVTWLGSNGFYVDLQGQMNWYGIDVITGSGASSIAAGTKLADGSDGFGWAVSLEAGKSFGFGRGWSVTPSAQLQYSKIRFDSFDGPGGGHSVNYDKGDSLIGRAGFEVGKDTAFTSACGSTRRLHAYGAINAYYDFRGETATYTHYQSTGIGNYYRSDNSRLELGVKLGATYAWADDKYAVFAEVGLRGSTKDMKDNYTVHGNAGFGINF